MCAHKEINQSSTDKRPFHLATVDDKTEDLTTLLYQKFVTVTFYG